MVEGPAAGPVTSVGEVLGAALDDTTLRLMSTGMFRMADSSCRNRSGQRRAMSKLRSPSIIWLNALPPTAVAITSCTSATLTPQRAHRWRSTGNVRFDWPMIWNTPASTMPSTPEIAWSTLSPSRSSSARSGPMIFTEFSPFTPESDSITLSRIFCEKLQSTPISVRSSSRLIASTNSGLVRRRDMPGGVGHCDCGLSVTKYSEL